MAKSPCARSAIVISAAPGLLRLAVLLVFSVLLVRPAHAQLLERYYPQGIPGYQNWFTDTVTARPVTEFTPLGTRVGAFDVFSNASQGIGYDSNILNSSTPLSSAYSETTADLEAKSDWGRNALNLDLSVDNNSFFEHSQASYTDWTAALGGLIDVGRDQISLSYAHYNIVTLPNEIGASGIGVPLPSQIDDLRAGYQISLGRLTVVPALEAASYRYPNQVFNGAVLDQSANNHTLLGGSVTAGYELAAGRSLVLVLSDNVGRYNNTPLGAIDQNFNDFTILAGIDSQLTGAVRYRLLAGYEQRSFTSSQVPTLTTPAGELDVIWTPRLDTTVTGRVTSTIQTSTTTATSSYNYVDSRLTVDHELRRNVRLQGYVEYQYASYQLNGGSQNSFAAGVSATWLLNRHLSLEARYRFSTNTYTAITGNDNSGSLVLVQLAVHL